MDIGLLITVSILGTLLGLFSRQVLKSVERQPSQNTAEPTTTVETEASQPHPHAI